MATIEERAKSWNADSARHHFTDMDDWQSGYIQGANEQRQIDIDKACDWLQNELGNSKSSAFWVLNLGVKRLISAFREAMTKEE